MMFSSVTGNTQKLDGGAMFGNAPKNLWESWCKPDENNRIHLAARGLLVETGNRKILFETGIGDFMEPHLKKRYGIQENGHVLLRSLDSMSLSQTDITDIFLSHLHFDHAGGLFSSWQDGTPPTLLFPNARYYCSFEAYLRSKEPHVRDKASFISGLSLQLEKSGRFVALKKNDIIKIHDLEITFFQSDGHTPGMFCSVLKWEYGRLMFASDLIPGIPWIHLPITMGYDRYPELLVNEKKMFLESAVEENSWVFFTHDIETAISKIHFDRSKNKFYAGETIGSFERITLSQ